MQAGLSVLASEQNRIARHSEPFAKGETSKVLAIYVYHQCNSFFLHRHVKALESRSQLLDAALASADEANRRWEECRALVDNLRLENNALRTALQEAQQQLSLRGVTDNGANESNSDEKKTD